MARWRRRAKEVALGIGRSNLREGPLPRDATPVINTIVTVSHTMEQTETDGTLLVAVGNIETAERLLDTATDIAADRSYDILLLYVVEVPAQVPLSEGTAFVDEEDRAVLSHAEELVEATGVPVESRIRYARNTATGIVGGAEEHDADLVVMGWRGRPPRRRVILGSYVDSVLRNAPCDVLVTRIRTPRAADVNGVLVPIASGPHTHLATELAGSIATRHDAHVTLMHVISENATDAEREDAAELLDQCKRLIEDVSVEQVIAESDHIAGRITDETAIHDVTILGASEQGLLRGKLLGTISESVGRNAAGTAMIAQRHPSTTSKRDGIDE